MSIHIWTDGACSGNPGIGGWAAILCEGDQERILQGSAPHTTNNRMELTAAIKALEACPKEASPQNIEIEIFTDSDYLKQGMTIWVKKWQRNGWRTANKKPVKNADLWRQLIALAEGRHIAWRWIKAHSGIEGNEKADRLAREALEREALERETLERGARP